MSVPDVEGYVMVLQPEEPKISLSGIDHFARSAAEFESQEGVTLFPELRIVSTITREVESDSESEVAEGADDDPTGKLLQTADNMDVSSEFFLTLSRPCSGLNGCVGSVNGCRDDQSLVTVRIMSRSRPGRREGGKR